MEGNSAAFQQRAFRYLKQNVEADERRSRSRKPARWKHGLASAAASAWKPTYTVAYIAHAPLEPRAAVAEWNDGKLTVWTGTQRPFGVRDELARSVPPCRRERARHRAGYRLGLRRQAHGDAALEAARLARAAGKPVKVVWTREEEFTWAYFRPAGVIEIKSGVAADGTLTAWEFHNYNSGAAGIGTPYDVAEPARSNFTRSTRRCGKVPIAVWRRPPIISPANRTWTNWRTPRTWIRWNFA